VADLSPPAVAARLARLRALYVADDEDAARRRLEDPSARAREQFAMAVARRLAELRALDELARYLHRARRAADGERAR
jgi:hypothetical protein